MLPRLAAALLLLLALTACGSEAGADEPAVEYSLKYEQPAPPFSGTLLTGEEVDNESMLGKPVILTFWATTCVPCRRELPMLYQLQQDHADDDLTILAVNSGDDEKAIKSFFDELSVDFPVFIDEDGQNVMRYEVLFLPMTYFIDRDGVLQYRTVGEPKERQIDHGVEVILAEA